jgi:hypothetical protein
MLFPGFKFLIKSENNFFFDQINCEKYRIFDTQKKLTSNLIIKIANFFQLIKNLYNIDFREFFCCCQIYYLFIFNYLYMALKVRLFENWKMVTIRGIEGMKIFIYFLINYSSSETNCLFQCFFLSIYFPSISLQ